MPARAVLFFPLARRPPAGGGDLTRARADDLSPVAPSFLGVLTAVKNVNDVLGPALVASGLQATQQKEIDDLLIKTDGVRPAP